ncbi:MAG: ribosome maturation factor RimP [Clostridia bacterium]|nr:ribosome maturation factor RimP [Clostridia bacterium]
MSKVEKIVWDAAAPIAERFGCSIYDVEYAKEGQNYFLRVFIDKDGGVSTDDCEAVSRALDPVLDELDPIENAYFLEISSPGLDRKLSRPEHFEAAVGKSVDIKLFSPIDGSKEITGILCGFDGKNISLETALGIVEIEKQKASVVRLTVIL